MARYSGFNTPYFGSNKESKAQLCGVQSGNCTGFRSSQYSSWTQREGERLHRISTCNEPSWSRCTYCRWTYEGFVSFQLLFIRTYFVIKYADLHSYFCFSDGNLSSHQRPCGKPSCIRPSLPNSSTNLSSGSSIGAATTSPQTRR